MISQGIEGGYQTLEPMGKIQISKGKPIKLSTTHFVFCVLNHLFLQEVVELVNAWGWEEYGSEIQIGKTSHF